jgi:transaldolase
MKFFVDSANPEDIKAAAALGLADGVTTNPTLIRKSGQDFKKTICAIADLVNGPVLSETISEDAPGIIREGRDMASWAPNVTVKIPVTGAGLEAVRALEEDGIRTAVTLVFSPAQALLAAKAGASMICPFVGRLDDAAANGMDLIRTIVDMYANYPEIETEVIVASVRTPAHVIESALAGADGVTIAFKLVEQLAAHPLTEAGVKKFLEDWKQVK